MKMTEFITLLNDNQGVIAVLVLVATFFVAKNFIKKSNKQSQKTGDSGVNQQAQSGGVNQNAGRDVMPK